MRIKTSGKTTTTARRIMGALVAQQDHWFSTEAVKDIIITTDTYNTVRSVLLKLAEVGQVAKRHEAGKWVFRTNVSNYDAAYPFEVQSDYVIDGREHDEGNDHTPYLPGDHPGGMPECGAFAIVGNTYDNRDYIVRTTTHPWFDRETKSWVCKATKASQQSVYDAAAEGKGLILRVPGPALLARYRAAKPGVLPGTPVPPATPGDDEDYVITEEKIKGKFEPKGPAADAARDKKIRDEVVEVLKHEMLNARESVRKQLTEKYDAEVKVLKDEIAALKKSDRTIKIAHPDKTVVKFGKGEVVPAIFDDVLAMARLRMNILICGPAGCGKSTLASLVAKALKLPFGKIGGCGGLTETHLLGRIKHNVTGGKEVYKDTPFTRAFEKGGVCLIDELDSADSNVLLALNPALDDSGTCPVPNRDEPLAKHKNFVCIATANTSGRGATRMYVGRNQLDEATLDRFRIATFDMTYDPTIEAAVCPDDELREWCQSLRVKIATVGLQRIMSTRFMAEAYKTLATGTWTLARIKEQYLGTWTKDEKNKCGIYDV